jgi:hypothetical protein
VLCIDGLFPYYVTSIIFGRHLLSQLEEAPRPGVKDPLITGLSVSPEENFPKYPPVYSINWGKREVAGSIPNGVIGIIQWHNPSGRSKVLGSTQPLTEMSTRNISWWVKAACAYC